MEKYQKWNTKKIEKFCEDNFLGEGFDEKLVTFLDGEEAILIMDSTDLPSTKNGVAQTELTIKIKLTEK